MKTNRNVPVSASAKTLGPVGKQPTKASPFPISKNTNLEVVDVIVG